ncbi:MAG: CDGSH iron-sulfur domain-containing protein, partial [Mariprofundaceae bacterium]|nr:CDGSH iron-sulfur domain-containing protein [Mariprofundaceae bacterium]
SHGRHHLALGILLQALSNFDHSGEVVSRQIIPLYHVCRSGKDPWGGYRSGFEARTLLHLSDYGMPFAPKLGSVAEEVELNISVERYQGEEIMTENNEGGKRPLILELEAGTHYLCSCGKSANHPFCDGSHADTAFTPNVIEITEKQTVALCQCKHSKKGAFCDGTHVSLL